MEDNSQGDDMGLPDSDDCAGSDEEDECEPDAG